jgi:uncharacterized protein YndB with AHSA1/START domain
MSTDLLARASTTVNAPKERVWRALVDPDAIRQYMFGTNVSSDWKEGSPITWKGEWKGASYEDKGTILNVEPGRLLRYSHFSPLSKLEDRPENYHTVTIELSGDDDHTEITLTQDNSATVEERDHSQKNWEMMLESLKAYLEQPE